MIDDNAIKDLDNAVSDSDGTDFEEEYPDAPEWAVELAAQAEANDEKVDVLERKKAERAATWKSVLKKSVETVRRKAASVAIASGTATKEEKQLLKGTDDSGEQEIDLDARAKFFVPESELEYHQ